MPKRLVAPALIQTAGAMFCAAISFVLMAWLARALGPATFGAFTAISATASVLLIAIEGGWPTLLYRERAAASHHLPGEAELASHALGQSLTATALLSIAALALAATGMIAVAWSAALACMGTVALANLISARMRGAGRFATEALWQAAGRLTSAAAIATYVALSTEPGPAGILLAWLAGLAALLPWGARWLAPPRVAGGLHMLRIAAPFAAVTGLGAWLLRGDLVTVGLLAGSSQVLADYAAGTRLTEAGLLLFAPIVNVLLRELRLRAAAGLGFRAFAQQAIVLGGLAGLAAWAVCTVFARPLVETIFGPDYPGTVSVLPWIMAMLPFAMMHAVAAVALAAAGRERAWAATLASAAILLPLAVAGGLAAAGGPGAALGAAAVHALAVIGAWQRLRSATVRA